jgi:hypothetical protein
LPVLSRPCFFVALTGIHINRGPWQTFYNDGCSPK